MIVKERRKYEQLRQQSPSLVGSSLVMFFYRYCFLFLAPVAVFIGISMIPSSTFGDMVIRLVANTSDKLANPTANRLTVILGLVMILVGMLLLLASRLAKKTMRRNLYILDLEDFINKQLEEK